MYKNQKTLQRTCLAILPLIVILLFSTISTAQSKVFEVENFDEIIISPHIEVVFKEGNKESVAIESITVPVEKLNVLVKNNTLNVYLDGAKIISNNRKEKINGNIQKKSVYNGTIVKAIITYKKLNSLDLRGEEKFVFENNIKSENLRLNIYGESQVYIKEVAIKNLQASMYGESYLEINKGTITNQKFTSYGESKVNTSGITNEETKLTAYGDGVFQFNISKELKITSYGEATIIYSGNPQVNKGIVIGDTKITQVNL